MLKIKNIISKIIFIFLISIQLPVGAGWDILGKPAEILGNKSVEAAKNAAQTAERIAQESGIPMSKQFGSDAAGKLASVGDKLAMVGGAVVCVTAAIQTGYLVKDIVSSAYPDGEKKARNQRGEEEYAYLIKRQEFKQCLLNNSAKPRNNAGRPIVCEETAKHLVMAVGNDKELKELTSMFKKYF